MVFPELAFIDRIERAANLGVNSVEFWEYQSKDLEDVMHRIHENQLELTAMVGLGEEAANLTAPSELDAAVSQIRQSISVAESIGCPNLIVLAGQDQDTDSIETQRKCVIDGLRRVAGDAENADITLLLEPLNRIVDHPGYFLTSSTSGTKIVKTVRSDAVQLLYDIYHQQITEGNILSTVTTHLDVIGHIHVADVPGRHEPGTGELNYPNILQELEQAGYDGYIGYEFEPRRPSEPVIDEIFNPQ